MLEINFGDEPWLVSDVTAEVDAEGERIRLDWIRQQKDRHGRGVDLLTREIERRDSDGEPPILKKAAEDWLMRVGGLKREPARNVTVDPVFERFPGMGPGHPNCLRLSVNFSSAAEIPHSQTSSVHAGSEDNDFEPSAPRADGRNRPL